MARWFIKNGIFEEGPFTAGEMRSKVNSGNVSETTLVRKDSAQKFMAARSFKGLISRAETAEEESPENAVINDAITETKDKQEDRQKTPLPIEPQDSIPENSSPEQDDHLEEISALSTAQDNIFEDPPQEQGHSDNDNHQAMQSATVRTEMLQTDITKPVHRDNSPVMNSISQAYTIIALIALALFMYLAV